MAYKQLGVVPAVDPDTATKEYVDGEQNSIDGGTPSSSDSSVIDGGTP